MTLEEIKRAFDPCSFARGLAYAEEGRVLSVIEPEPGIINATVRGSGGVRYAPSIVLGARRTRGDWVEADCDCPATGFERIANGCSSAPAGHPLTGGLREERPR